MDEKAEWGRPSGMEPAPPRPTPLLDELPAHERTGGPDPLQQVPGPSEAAEEAPRGGRWRRAARWVGGVLLDSLVMGDGR